MGKPPMSAQYVCVHVPSLPAQALARLRPELARLPLVVLEGEPPFEQVASANTRARRFGVRDAMTRVELDSFTGLTILRRSMAEERSAQAVLLGAAAAFTPRVQVWPVPGTGWAMVLDMTGSSSLFGPVQQVVQRIAEAVKSLNFAARIAASANFRTAVCMASSARRSQCIIPDDEEALALAPLPLAALDLTPQQSEAFTLWGLSSIGELAALPEAELVVRLGPEGHRLSLLARGKHPHLMVPEEAPFTLEEFLALDSPVDLLDSLLFVLGAMLSQLIIRAQNHAFALANVSVRLGLEHAGEHLRTIKPAQPVSERELLLKLLHLDLQAHPPPAAIVSVFVSAQPGKRSQVQGGLFSPQLPDPLRLDVTLARIAALVGEDRVGRPVLKDTHQPESFSMERFIVPSAQQAAPVQHSRSVALRRCRPPVLIHMQKHGERLQSFFMHGIRYTIEQAYGPWRRSGTWWSSQVWSHEEWDIQAAQHTASPQALLCLIVHDLLSNQWSLEALYD